MPFTILDFTKEDSRKATDMSDFTLKQIDELSLLREVEQIKRFSRECDFSEQQTSALLSIIKRTHGKAVETPFGNVDSTFEYFQELILKHSVRRPPFSVEIFSTEEANKIIEYVLNTHFKLYKYAFTSKIRLNLNIDYLGLPPTPEPELSEEKTSNETEDIESKDEGLEDDSTVESNQVEEPPAVQELKTMINSALKEQVQKLKTNVDQQLKTNEDAIMKKLAETAGGAERSASRKSKKK
eukprot:gene14030-15489_t